MVNAASEKQIRFIMMLRKRLGMSYQESDMTLTSKGASTLIEELKEHLAKGGPQPRPDRQPGELNQARLGMAVKEVFRGWKSLGRDMHNGKRQDFVNECLQTYELFSEVADRAGAEAPA